GRLTHYPGGYQYYLDKTSAASERAGLTSGQDKFKVAKPASQDGAQASPAAARKEQKRLEAEGRQARSRVRQAQRQRVHQLEKQIQELELRQTEMLAELEKQETYEKPGRAQAINRELVAVQQQLGQLNPEWEEEATRLAKLE